MNIYNGNLKLSDGILFNQKNYSEFIVSGIINRIGSVGEIIDKLRETGILISKKEEGFYREEENLICEESNKALAKEIRSDNFSVLSNISKDLIEVSVIGNYINIRMNCGDRKVNVYSTYFSHYFSFMNVVARNLDQKKYYLRFGKTVMEEKRRDVSAIIVKIKDEMNVRIHKKTLFQSSFIMIGEQEDILIRIQPRINIMKHIFYPTIRKIKLRYEKEGK